MKSSMLFRTPSHTEVTEAVVADVLAGRAIIAVRGDPGVGKTTQMRVIASKLAMQQRMVVMTGAPSLTPSKVLRLIGEAVGLADAASLPPARLLEILQERERTERLVLLIDDIQALSPAMFRYLGLLIELFDLRPVKLQLILFGPAGQWSSLQEPDLELMRRATFSRHIIYAPPASPAPLPDEYLGRTDPFSSPPRQAQGKWSRRASIAALCLLFVTGATVTFLVSEADPSSAPVRATERRPLLPPTLAVPPAQPASQPATQPAEPTAPARPAEVMEAVTAPTPPPSMPQNTETGPETQAGTGQEQLARPEDDARPARSGGPGLVLIAGAGDDLPNLYARVYRGLEPPPYPQVVAANRMPLKPGALVVFPEPPSGWPSH